MLRSLNYHDELDRTVDLLDGAARLSAVVATSLSKRTTGTT
ncbi:MAG TPA: hypothetical protein VME44_19675 [Streptosporangiaceae bacterium]|nr:hypothetical protein [Streptosporangiaceae bacterium]